MAASYPGNPVAIESPSLAFGPGVVPTVSLPADTDGASWANIQQSQKLAADGLAYLMDGHYSSFYQENWNLTTSGLTTSQNPVPNYAPARVAISGSSWSVAFAGNAVMMAALTSSGDSCYITSGAPIINTSVINTLGTTGLQFSIEFDVSTATTPANGSLRIGVGNTQTLDTATNYAFVQALSGASVWTLNVSGTTSVTTAPVGPGRIKIVSFGSATPTGIAHGSAWTLLYINDTLIASVNAAPTSGMYYSFGYKVTGSINGTTLTVGTTTMRWNRF